MRRMRGCGDAVAFENKLRFAPLQEPTVLGTAKLLYEKFACVHTFLRLVYRVTEYLFSKVEIRGRLLRHHGFLFIYKTVL